MSDSHSRSIRSSALLQSQLKATHKVADGHIFFDIQRQEHDNESVNQKFETSVIVVPIDFGRFNPYVITVFTGNSSSDALIWFLIDISKDLEGFFFRKLKIHGVFFKDDERKEMSEKFFESLYAHASEVIANLSVFACPRKTFLAQTRNAENVLEVGKLQRNRFTLGNDNSR